MYYAQINQDRIAYAVTETAGQIDAPDMIQLESFDTSVIGKRHTEQGAWEDVPTPPAPEPEWTWYIDLGPFYDRFGATKMAVLTSADTGVKAILADLNIRKWVDLKRPDVAQAMAYVGSVVPIVDAGLQDHILNTPVTDLENRALRKLYFS